jgi:hypothetical protein
VLFRSWAVRVYRLEGRAYQTLKPYKYTVRSQFKGQRIVSFFKKLKSQVLGDELSEAELNAPPAGAKPGLRFNNIQNPEGPHFVLFDAISQRDDGATALVLDLCGAGGTKEAQARLELCLEALEQNEEAMCDIRMTEADLKILDRFLEQLASKYQNAFTRTDVFIPGTP